MDNLPSEIRWTTKDEKILNDPDYIKIIDVVKRLWMSGVIIHGFGQCFGMSDIVYHLLKEIGIECAIVECSLLIRGKYPPSLNIIGYNNNVRLKNDNEATTHVVCVTKNTKYPILIDLSISEFIKTIPYVCEPVDFSFAGDDDLNRIAKYDFEEAIFTYTQKKDQKLAAVHERSIVDRLNMDNKFISDISLLKKVLIFLMCVTSINFIRGTFDFSQKYLIKNNGFGPNQLEHVKK